MLHSHLFWAFDASNSGVPVFNPLFGFSKISAPQINAEIEMFKDGTFIYNRAVVKGGSVGQILFERATSMFDADFYDWIMFTLHGNKDFEEGGTLGKIASFLTGSGRSSPRRSLLIVQFTNINIAGGGSDRDIALRVAGTAALAAITAGLASSSVAGAAIAGAAVGGAVAYGIGPFEFATRIPARAWLLHDCLPVRYKAGSDFDAGNAAISLQELEVQPEHIEEFSLGIKP